MTDDAPLPTSPPSDELAARILEHAAFDPADGITCGLSGSALEVARQLYERTLRQLTDGPQGGSERALRVSVAAAYLQRLAQFAGGEQAMGVWEMADALIAMADYREFCDWAVENADLEDAIAELRAFYDWEQVIAMPKMSEGEIDAAERRLIAMVEDWVARHGTDDIDQFKRSMWEEVIQHDDRLKAMILIRGQERFLAIFEAADRRAEEAERASSN